ncbi:hypothetical protein [Rhodopseudomonas telluris]|uniref:Uncharacterized protein n=1 Tax=Rhodopseudomonas telluris TaxID=644215 RepID=A0ABV6EVU6_9BRAD
MFENLVKFRSPAAEDPLTVHFALVLSRLIDAAQADQAQLRHTIYELARVKLREEFRGRKDCDIERLAAAFDGAIENLESFSEPRDARPLWPSALSRLAEPDDVVPPFVAARKILQARPIEGAGEDCSDEQTVPDPFSAARVRQLSRGSFPVASIAAVGRLALIGILIAGAAAVALNWGRVQSTIAEELAAAPADTSVQIRSEAANMALAPPSSTAPPLPSKPAGPGFPLPSSFGVYAIDGDRLVELKALPGRVPDLRVAISAAITAPSEAQIASVQPRFVMFRRDLVPNAPDAVQMRVLAKVRNASASRRDVKSSEIREPDAWVIRNISVPYRVAPIDGQSEMLLIQPEVDDRPLPSGRYILVIKGQAFDLSIAGAITAPQQCVERVNATNGTFYMPCPGG